MLLHGSSSALFRTQVESSTDDEIELAPMGGELDRADVMKDSLIYEGTAPPPQATVTRPRRLSGPGRGRPGSGAPC